MVVFRIRSANEFSYAARFKAVYGINFWVDSFRTTITSFYWGDGSAVSGGYYCAGEPNNSGGLVLFFLLAYDNL